MRAYPEWFEADILASCKKCRCLVVLRKHERDHRRFRMLNPYASDRDRIAKGVGANASQGSQTPGGFTHRGCLPFDWTGAHP